MRDEGECGGSRSIPTVLFSSHLCVPSVHCLICMMHCLRCNNGLKVRQRARQTSRHLFWHCCLSVPTVRQMGANVQDPDTAYLRGQHDALSSSMRIFWSTFGLCTFSDHDGLTGSCMCFPGDI